MTQLLYFFHYFTLNNGWPYSTICPSSTNISTISPEISASPMVGTFYKSPSPEEGAYVQVGDKVSNDTTVCILVSLFHLK
jgi:biotin carboxyl carrier protein